MGRALTSSRAPNTSHKMRMRPLRRRVQNDGGAGPKRRGGGGGGWGPLALIFLRKGEGRGGLGEGQASPMSKWDDSTTGLRGFVFLRAIHDFADGFAGREGVVEDGVDLLGYGQFDAVLLGQCQQGRGGADAFGDHAHGGENFIEFAACA